MDERSSAGGGVPDPAQATALLELYDRGLPHVYGYLVSRCGDRALAEDLCAETFLAAVAAVRTHTVAELTIPWLIGVARHKLVDHWRRAAREERKLAAVESEVEEGDDPWDRHLDRAAARHALAELGPHHRAALTLRYVDGLAVADVAAHLERTVHAAEALLVRARRAFRQRYEQLGYRDGEEVDDDG